MSFSFWLTIFSKIMGVNWRTLTSLAPSTHWEFCILILKLIVKMAPEMSGFFNWLPLLHNLCDISYDTCGSILHVTPRIMEKSNFKKVWYKILQNYTTDEPCEKFNALIHSACDLNSVGDYNIPWMYFWRIRSKMFRVCHLEMMEFWTFFINLQ